MGKKRRGRSRGFVAIPFSGTISLSNLANNSVASADLLSSVLDEDFFCISADINWGRRSATVGEGPVLVGVAHNVYSGTEVAEKLAAEQSGPDDLITIERARRKVRLAGSFAGQVADEALNDGKPIRTTVKWSVGDGQNLSCFCVNRSGSALTSGSIIAFDGTAYGRWQR